MKNVKLKKNILLILTIVTPMAYSSQTHNGLAVLDMPITKLCTIGITEKNKKPVKINGFVTIVDYGNQFYIIPEPKTASNVVLSPSLGYSDKGGIESGVADRNNIIFIKELFKNKGIYNLYDTKEKVTITYLCP